MHYHFSTMLSVLKLKIKLELLKLLAQRQLIWFILFLLSFEPEAVSFPLFLLYDSHYIYSPYTVNEWTFNSSVFAKYNTHMYELVDKERLIFPSLLSTSLPSTNPLLHIIPTQWSYGLIIATNAYQSEQYVVVRKS